MSLTLTLLLAACEQESFGVSGTARISIRAQPEAFDTAFTDGFEVTFNHVVVCLAGFGLEDEAGTTAALSVDGIIIDVRNGGSELWQERAPAGSFARASFRTRAARHSDRIIGDVNDNEIHYMLQHGYGVTVSGTATKDGETFTFLLGLPPTRYERCESGGGPEPIEIVEGATTDVEIDFHFEHLFYDSLASETGHLRFEPFAAAAFSNDVTNPFLSQSIDSLVDRSGNPLMDGGEPVVYDPAPFSITPRTLEQYFIAAGRSMGHVNGGACEAVID